MVASTHRGSLLRDLACKDPRSGSIIVVISVPLWSLSFQAACLDLPAFSLFTASQGNRERARGWPHGSMTLFSYGGNTAVCSFEAWTQEGFHFSAGLLYSHVYSTCSIGKYNDQRNFKWSDMIQMQLKSYSETLAAKPVSVSKHQPHLFHTYLLLSLNSYFCLY